MESTAPSAGPGVPDRGHILFVDDEPLVAEVSKEILAGLGYRVTVRGDGLEGLATFREAWRAVDLVILDMVMPRLGGKDTFLAMRAIHPGVKVLLISGYSVEGEAQQLLHAGAMGFLQKPYRGAELAREVERILAAGDR